MGRFTLKLGLMTASVGLWLAAVLFALTYFGRFDAAAGNAGHPPAQWRGASAQREPAYGAAPLALDASKPTLLVLVHPQCPCSRATLSELNRLAALCLNCAAMTVLFLRPAGYSDAWVKTELWRQAAAIPGVRVRADDGGLLARRLGAATSGETLLYDPQGRLLYHGGLTGSRGHEGDNAGLSAVSALILRYKFLRIASSSERPQAAQQPVYGCPLTAHRAEITSIAPK